MTDEAPEILLVEDERKLAEVIADYIRREGFSVLILTRGEQVVDRVRLKPPKLIVLDLNLPGGLDGVAICEKLRTFSDVPATARVDQIDRLKGLNIGADDYVCKPYDPLELVARIKAVLRRASGPKNVGQFVQVGDLQLDLQQRTLKIKGQPLDLTRAEYDLIAALMEQPARIFSRRQLLVATSGTDHAAYERTIDSHVKNLRKKMAAVDPEHQWIASVYGAGYRLNKT